VVKVTETTLETTRVPTANRNRTPVVALLVANGISLTGNSLTALAIPWFVLVTTGSAARTGVAAFAQMVPTVMASFFGGALVDRVGNKRLSIVADVTSGLTVAAVPLLYHTVGLEFWQLLVLIFLGAMLDAPGSTAREAMLPELVERAGMRLEKANAAIHVIRSGSLLIGPVMAGLLVSTLGASNVLWIDAASFALSALIFAVFVPSLPAKERNEGSFRDEVLEGLRFLRRDQMLWAIVVLAAILNFVGAPLFAVVLPVYVKETYDSPSALGLMIAGLGAGAVIGALGYGSIGHRYSRWRSMVALLFLASTSFVAMVLLPPLAVAVGVLVVVGVANGVINPIIATVLQERTPAELRGRVFGTVSATAMVATPAGMLIAGVALEAAGVRTVLAVIATAFVLVTVAFTIQPSVRDMDRVPKST
jgi:MFS family permease